MKARIDRAPLADALTWVARAIPKRASIPVLAGVWLSASDDVLTLRAFDYEVGHEARLPCEVVAEGECVVSGHFLREVVAGAKDASVELVLDGARLTIALARSSYRTAVMATEDYPSLPEFPEQRGTIAAEALASLLGTVEHATSKDLVLPVLTAVQLVGDDTGLTATATDRFRVARRTVDWDGSPFTALVPAAGLSAAVEGLAGEVAIGHAGGLFGVADSSRRITTRCLDDDYPKLDALLGMAPAEHQVEVDAADLAGAVKRAIVAAEDQGATQLDVDSGQIAVTTGGESAEGAEYVECDGEAVCAASVNGRFLTDALAAAGSGRVALGIRPGVKPLSITPVDRDRTDLIVMTRRSSK